MVNMTLTDTLSGCVDHCGWCLHQCPEEDKYEILVTCLKLQSGFNKLYLSVYLQLSDRSADTIKNFSTFYSKFALYYQRRENVQIKNLGKKELNTEDFEKLPGCSQIFHISQILNETYLNKLYGNE
jgi:hypothetical protein